MTTDVAALNAALSIKRGSRPMHYVLRGHDVVPAHDWLEWAEWMQANKYRRPPMPVRQRRHPSGPSTPRPALPGTRLVLPSAVRSHRTTARWRHHATESDDGPWRVASSHVGDQWISTVFLGLDHEWGDGPPLLFETMIFGGVLDQWQARTSTWAEAEIMHRHAFALTLTRHDPEWDDE